MEEYYEICRVFIIEAIASRNLSEDQIEKLEKMIDEIRVHKELDGGFNIKHQLDGHFTNIEIQTTNCPKNHCLQCLEKYFESQGCDHNVKFTRFEQKHIPWLLNALINLDSAMLPIKNACCFLCNTPYKLKSLLDQKCLCRICDKCLFLNYSNRILSCPSCLRDYDKKDIKEIYEIGKNANPDEKIPIFDKCNICKGIFDEDSFYNKCLCGYLICIACNLNIEKCPKCQHQIKIEKEAGEEKAEEGKAEEKAEEGKAEEEEDKNEIPEEREEGDKVAVNKEEEKKEEENLRKSK